MEETHLTALKEWVECFKKDETQGDETDEDAAKREIKKTLMNRDTWKERSENFLLRLISDDDSGYRNRRYDEPRSNRSEDVNGYPLSERRPRVQLALAFVEHMDTMDTKFIDFLRTSINADESEVGSTQNTPVSYTHLTLPTIYSV